MLFNTSKNKGRAGLSLAIAYFGANGYTVCLPLNDTQNYDLIVDNGDKLQKISVRATNQRSPYQIYVIDLRSTGGTKGKEYSRFGEEGSDALFVLCGNGDMYLIPKEVCGNQRQLNLGEKVQEYKVML